MKSIILIFFAAIFLFSCSQRNLVYLSDLDNTRMHTEAIRNSSEPKIQPDDLLNISITSLNPEANVLFNKGEVMPVGNSGGYSGGGTGISSEGYLVDKEGNIDFPVLGKIHLGGLTKAEAKARLNARLEYYLKEPMVNIRFMNFKITVIGEVNRPSTITIPTEKINILEALGMAGDMTAYGKRENVLVIREVEGQRIITRLNLNSKEVLNSPFFFLQQNDIVYVEPDKVKADQVSTRRNDISMALSVASFLTILLSTFVIR